MYVNLDMLLLDASEFFKIGRVQPHVSLTVKP